MQRLNVMQVPRRCFGSLLGLRGSKLAPRGPNSYPRQKHLQRRRCRCLPEPAYQLHPGARPQHSPDAGEHPPKQLDSFLPERHLRVRRCVDEPLLCGARPERHDGRGEALWDQGLGPSVQHGGGEPRHRGQQWIEWVVFRRPCVHTRLPHRFIPNDAHQAESLAECVGDV